MLDFRSGVFGGRSGGATVPPPNSSHRNVIVRPDTQGGLHGRSCHFDA